MSDLYSVISGMQPDQQDIVEAELLTRQILEANYPDLDLREGTGIRDLLVRPSAFILALCKKGVEYYFSQNTQNKVDNSTPTEIVDDILSNLFLTRNTGTYAVISARLYFARQKSVSLNTNVSFSTDGNLLFFPSSAVSYPSTAMQYDSFQNEWFIDVELTAASKGVAYNISSGSLLYFTNFDPYFLHGEINFLSSVSTEPETNLQFIARAQYSISTRNLINKPSILNRLTSDLNFLNRIKVIGAGEAEIYRDQAWVRGGPGTSRNASSMVLTDGNLKMQIYMPTHGFVVNQQLSVIESGSSVSKLVLNRVHVTDVVDADNFKINIDVSVTPRTFLYPVVTPLEEDVYIHLGGQVDIHLSETVSSSLHQYTLDSTGSVNLTGPIYSIVRSSVSPGTADTVPFGTPFTITYPGHTQDNSATFSQDGTGTITVVLKNHPMSVGRMVNIVGWPTGSSNLQFTVSSVIDGNTFKVGSGLPIYTVDSGLSPYIKYVYPGKDVGFSQRQVLKVSFGPTYAGGTASFTSSQFEYLDSVQPYLELPENRVVCADPLARGFDIYALNVGITVYDTTLPTTGYVQTLVNDFLKTLAPGQDFILSDLVAYLTSTGGITNLQTPLNVTYTYYTKDMFPGRAGTVTDVLMAESSTSIYIVNYVSTALIHL